MGKKKGKRKHKVSSGQKHQRAARCEARRLRMKIARWERNQSDPTKDIKLAKDHSCNSSCQSRHMGWNTTGLKRSLKYQETILKRPALRP